MKPRCGGLDRELRQQPGLADAGIPADQQDVGLASLGIAQQLPHPAELGSPARQGAATPASDPAPSTLSAIKHGP